MKQLIQCMGMLMLLFGLSSRVSADPFPACIIGTERNKRVALHCKRERPVHAG